jgi:hypothetical protein
VSWRASLLAALMVIVAGVAAGFVVGGGNTTQVRTTTVVRTVKVVTTVPASTTPSTSTGESTEIGNPATGSAGESGSGGSSSGQERYLADYLESEGGESAIDNNAENASMLDNPNQQELGGKVYQHAVAFELDAPGESESASVQIPTPGFTRLTAPAVGLETTANANAAYQLTIYKNNDNSPHSVVLYQDTFHGPSSIRKVSFALQGAADIVLVWTHRAAEPDYEDTFVLADPVLIGS